MGEKVLPPHVWGICFRYRASTHWVLLSRGSGRGDNRLVAHWKFDEGSGETVKDFSVNGIDGTIVPANVPETKMGTGNFAGSISLSGASDNHVRIPSSKSLNKLIKQITLVAHIYPRDALVSRLTFHRIYIGRPTPMERSCPPRFILPRLRAKKNVLHYKWHLGLVGAEVEIFALPKGQDKPRVGGWVHLAGTYNGETGNMSLYVDGNGIGKRKRVGEKSARSGKIGSAARDWS